MGKDSGLGSGKSNPDKYASDVPGVSYRFRCAGHAESDRCVLEDGHAGDHKQTWSDAPTRCAYVFGDTSPRCRRHAGHSGEHEAGR
jgi:hypothetical protein